LQATDARGNVSRTFNLAFTLDTTAPVPAFDLAPAFDSAPVGDHQTTFATVTLTGQTDPNLTVVLQPAGVSARPDAAGGFQFTGIRLSSGDNRFHVRTTDAAGNQGTAVRTITRVTSTASVPCGFEDGLAGWDVVERGGTTAARGTVAAADDRATLREGNS